MSFIGTVSENGTVVVLPPEAKLPAGTQVRVEEIQATDGTPSIWEKLSAFSGVATDLPPDMAENHDHYVHGTPKRRKE